MQGFVRLEGMTENRLLGVCFSATAPLYFRGRGIYRMKTVAGASPDLHLVAGPYHASGAQPLIIIWTARGEMG